MTTGVWRARRAVVPGLALAVVVPLASCGLLGDDSAERAGAAVDAYAAGMAGGDVEGAAAATSDPDAAAAALGALVDGLGLDAVSVDGGEPDCADGTCAVDLAYSADVPGLGAWEWTTSAVVRVPDDGDAPADLAWEPTALHPQAVDGATWRRTRDLPPRAPVLDREGQPLTQERPVVRIGVEPRRVSDLDAVGALLAESFGVDAARFAEQVRGAQPDAFVEALVVRAEDLSPWRSRFEALDGVLLRDDQLALTPDRGFARALLGVVGTATAEALEDAGPSAQAGDAIGLSGLQRAYQQQLAGTPGGAVEVRQPDGGGQVVHAVEPVAGEPLATTLDLDVQTAAETAVRTAPSNASLVVVQPSTGAVLASANGPVATGDDRAFTGQYPPGSTFKVVTTDALLAAGLQPSEPLACPPEATVGGRTFTNAEGGSIPGASDFADAFARSCNTTFVALADRLDEGALAQAAARLGMGADWGLGVPAYSGQVPTEYVDVVDEAAAMIGQSTVLASPLAMAVATASAVSGRTVVPGLLPQASPTQLGPELDAARAATIRDLMRGVVTGGTGSALAGVQPEVIAKTGTAEYGTADPATGDYPTHAWVVAVQGDLAVAVVVEGGGGGGSVAGPVARTFFDALPTSP